MQSLGRSCLRTFVDGLLSEESFNCYGTYQHLKYKYRENRNHCLWIQNETRRSGISVPAGRRRRSEISASRLRVSRPVACPFISFLLKIFVAVQKLKHSPAVVFSVTEVIS